MELVLLLVGLLIGGGGAYAAFQKKLSGIENKFVLVPRDSIGESLEISTGGGDLMCPHCNGLLKETVEAAILIGTKFPDQAEIRVYRHHAPRHPYAESVDLGSVYFYQDIIFPFEIPEVTQQELSRWVLGSSISKSGVEWVEKRTMRIWDALSGNRTGYSRGYPNKQRRLDHDRMTAGFRRILRLEGLQLYDPSLDDAPHREDLTIEVLPPN